MKITPLEIRQKSFEKNLRGYDKDEVTAFLVTLSQEWERALDEMKELKIRLDASEREVSKLREVESSLYKTLKTAEDTGASLIEQATKTAELHLKESQLNAEALLNETKAKAKSMMEEAENKTQQVIYEMETRLKELIQQYRGLALHRDNLVADLNRMANESIDRVDRLKKVNEEFSPDQFLSQAKKEIKKIINPNEDQFVQVESEKTEALKSEIRKEPLVTSRSAESKVVIQEKVKIESTVQKSFFDEIG